jgi:hypothetical protein
MFVLLASAVPAGAQQPGPQPIEKPGDTMAFLPRFNFQLVGNALSGGDPQFTSNAHFGGAADLVDYAYGIKGRLSVVADYEAVLGVEHQLFDPNQDYYILETSASGWAGRNEIALVFHHVSRHLSDRFKDYAIAWNVLGVRFLRTFDAGDGTSVAVRAGAGHIVTHATVDYSSTADFDVTVRRALNPHVGVFAHGTGQVFTVNPEVLGRSDAQYGGRFEGGVRFDGRGGAIELFAGVEHRLDADPVAFVPLTWAIAGFRIASK